MAPSIAQTNDVPDDEPIAERFLKRLPPVSRQRLQHAGVDLSHGYPWIPSPIPKYVDKVFEIRNHEKY
jgi:hypothetical protein